MTVRSRVVRAACAALAATTLALPVGATTLLPQNVAQLTVSSDVVLEGLVTAIESRWHEDHRTIYTYVTVDVSDVHKGQVPRRIVLEELGGEVGGLRAVVPSTPEFVVGERTFVFGYTTPHGTLRTLGFAMGKFSIEQDDKTGRELAVRPEWADRAFNHGPDGSLDATVDASSGKRYYDRLVEEVQAYRDRLFVEGAVGGIGR